MKHIAYIVQDGVQNIDHVSFIFAWIRKKFHWIFKVNKIIILKFVKKIIRKKKVRT